VASVRQMSRASRFAAGLYRERAGWAYHAHLGRDPLAQLRTRSGQRDPYPIYERIRAGGPLSRTRLGNWMTPSHDVCNRVLRDRRFGARSEDAPPVNADGFSLSFLEMNPPDHTRLRRLVTPAFGPRRVAAYRPRIEKTVHQLLDDVDGTFDLVSAFAAPLPITVISDLLGVPHERAGDFARYGATIGSALDGIRSVSHARELMAADAELRQMFAELFALRRREPSDDVVSVIVAAEGMQQVQPEEMVPLCILLLIAGFETTVNLISNAVTALLAHPEQWAAVCADPGLAGAAVEETLRYDPPVQRTSRAALEDVDLDGRSVRRNELVVTLIGAANRDPDVYHDPARFDITRPQTVEHLAFSGGIHYCLGQALARLEATIALETLVQRMPSLHRAGRIVRRDATTIRGPLRLPVRA
jgi:P450-derived glycosyltransferase activator